MTAIHSIRESCPHLELDLDKGRARAGSISDPAVDAVTLVVDRDSVRGLRLALSASVSTLDGRKSQTPTSITVVTRPEVAEGFRAECDPTEFQKIDLLLCDDGGGADEGIPAPKQIFGSVLVLDNPPNDDTLLQAQKNFERVVIISAYPVYRPGVDAIVAANSRNKFMWPSLYEAFLKRCEDDKFTEEFEKLTAPGSHVYDRAICLRIQGGDGSAERTWSLTTLTPTQF